MTIDKIINTVICGDCLEVMKDWPDNCVDLVLTDPPYGIGEDSRKADNSGRLEFVGDWDYRPHNKVFLAILRIAKNSIIWGGNYFASTLPDSRGWFVWDKMQKFTGADCELAWTSFNFSTKTFRKSRVEVHTNMDKQHSTQKPLELMLWCLSFTSNADLILDPFCGSGTTCVAAKMLGRRYIDISEEYCEIARMRLKAVDTCVPVREQKRGQLGLFERENKC